MTEKELKKLSRKDLLYILVSQGKELQELKADYENAQAALKDRSIHLENRKFMEQDESSMRRKSESLEIPETERLEAELDRVTHRSRFHSVLRSTIYTLIVVAAVSVLVATIWLPILQIYGASMTPTLKEGDIVVSVKGTQFQSGDLIAFYVGNKILVKRCIALPGQWVDLDEDGNVFVDGELLDEPYLTEKSFGDANIELPYQVPDEKYFCLGDHRATSVDSRHTEIGCVSKEQIVGKIVFRVWPISEIGTVERRYQQ